MPVSLDLCIDELRNLVLDLDDPDEREPLRVALRFHPDYQDSHLLTRRERYNSDLDKARMKVNPRTLQRREDSAIHTLVTRLIDEHAGQLRQPRSTETTPGTGDLRMDSRELWYIFGKGRKLQAKICALQLIALTEGHHSYTTRTEYYSDRTEGVLEVLPLFGCELADSSFLDDHLVTHLAIPKLMHVGDTQAMMYKVLVHSERPCRPLLKRSVRAVATETMHIEFHTDCIPREVWSFSDLSGLEDRDPRTTRQKLHPMSGSRYIDHAWLDVQRGRSRGLSWDWGSAEVPEGVPPW
jgi:hypothetical protein